MTDTPMHPAALVAAANGGRGQPPILVVLATSTAGWPGQAEMVSRAPAARRAGGSLRPGSGGGINGRASAGLAGSSRYPRIRRGLRTGPSDRGDDLWQPGLLPGAGGSGREAGLTRTSPAFDHGRGRGQGHSTRMHQPVRTPAARVHSRPPSRVVNGSAMITGTPLTSAGTTRFRPATP